MSYSSSTGTKNKSIGLVQCFPVNHHQEVEKAIEDCAKLGIKEIRINISWAEWYSTDGKQWYDWLINKLGEHLNILPCILYTPAALGLKPKTSAPPIDPQAYADFVGQVVKEYGKYFEYIEFWNEPNNQAEYDYTLDTDWSIFCNMISNAASMANEHGKKTVLGGMNPVDPNWLNQLFAKGAMDNIDVVGIHGFPEVFDNSWEGWDAEIEKVRQVLDEHASTAKIWITEAGYSTWQKNERKQLKEFINAVNANAERIYWNGLTDVCAEQQATVTANMDIRKNHFGMKNQDGSPKLLYTLLATQGIDKIDKFDWLTEPVVNAPKESYVLITGGAGFVGTNLADRLMSEGKKVMVFDNLSRAGVENNLFWLKEKHKDKLSIMVADIRDKAAITKAVANAEQVFHFAAQVAVTSSLVNPYHDFEVNALGTLNLMEAVRNSAHQPPVIFTSTNKVYGDLHDLGIVMNCTRYYPENVHFKANGISEARPLDFHSPYGCTKGVADQYILDYARTFGLKTVVFRMSCIYGLHQFGTEDQGWVAHFLIQALKKKPIILYGDGKQVRDILFVHDLVNAFQLAMANIEKISGNAFNMGGGVTNSVSLLELVDMIGEIAGEKPQVVLSDWRPSDQKYYVSDYNKFKSVTGWSPATTPKEGVRQLYEWLQENVVKTTVKKESRATKKVASTIA
jgi:CDP-paratose 2-epimerase